MVLFSKGKESASKPPLGKGKRFLIRISRNLPSQEKQDFAPKVISLICNQKFNTPRGDID